MFCFVSCFLFSLPHFVLQWQKLLQDLTPELQAWPPPVVFFLVSSCSWEGWGRKGTGASQDKQLPLSRAPGRGRGSSPRCTHLRISTAGPSPRRPAGRTGDEQVLDWAALESSRGSQGIYSIQNQRIALLFFFFLPFPRTTQFYIRL